MKKYRNNFTKNPKTTLIGIAILCVTVCSILGVKYKYFTLTELCTGLAAIAGSLKGLEYIFVKQDKANQTPPKQ